MHNETRKKKNIKQLTIELDAELLHEFKVVAVRKSITMADLIRSYIKTELISYYKLTNYIKKVDYDDEI